MKKKQVIQSFCKLVDHSFMQIYSLFESTLRFLFIADRNEETIAEFVAGILWRKKENSKPWAILPRTIDEYQ